MSDLDHGPQGAGSAEDYAGMLAALLPPGPFWQGFRTSGGLGRAILEAKGDSLAYVDQRAHQLISEANPIGALEMLPSREIEAALPDDCVQADVTIEERRLALIAQWANRGGQSLQFFQGIATTLGYTVEIEEFRPFIAGLSKCGEQLNGAASCRFYWRVRVVGPRITYFKTGASRCGERLGIVRRAEDMECLFYRLAPAHSKLIFQYEGV